MGRKLSMQPLSVSLALIIALILLVNINLTRAGGLGSIDPNQALDTVTLYSAQSASFSTSQTSSIGSHAVGVVSINNQALTATLTINTPGAVGFWTILMIGTGRSNWIDLGIGFVFPSGGLTAAVDVDTDLAVGLAIGSVFVSSPPVSPAEPFRYSIRVAGTAR
ncbi:MAG: hypothetical protein KAS98_10535 [Deltaproteobacteria bacterium]|nr:hypothetical protein [Deltaproteobacteria bacterium]